MLQRRDLSRTFSAISRAGYDDELVAKIVSAGAASSIFPHSGILISSFSGTASTTSHASSSASATDPAAFASPTSPEAGAPRPPPTRPAALREPHLTRGGQPTRVLLAMLVHHLR